MRKFKSISSAKAVAALTGKAIVVRQWSEADDCWLIKFGPQPFKSSLMAGVI